MYIASYGYVRIFLSFVLIYFVAIGQELQVCVSYDSSLHSFINVNWTVS